MRLAPSTGVPGSNGILGPGLPARVLAWTRMSMNAVIEAPRQQERGRNNVCRNRRRSWVIERTLAWFARFRRLTVCYERRLDILLGVHLLAAALI
jgi:transposase